MAKKSDKKLKMPVKRIFSNNFFMLKLIYSASRPVVFTETITTVIEALTAFISNTFLLRYALNGINENRSFNEIAITILLWVAVRIAVLILSEIYYFCFYNIKITDVNKSIYDIVYKKALGVDLECYENPQYYNEMAKAIDECSSRSGAVLQAFNDLVYRIVTFSSNLFLVLAIDPLLLVFVLIPIIVSPIQAKINKINYDKSMQYKEINREKDYSRRTFYLSDYAKEMRLSQIPALMLRRFTESGERIRDVVKKYGFKMSVLGYIVIEATQMLTPCATALYSAYMTFVKKSMGYGDCIVIVNSISGISQSLTYSTKLLLKFQENAMYIDNIRNFLDYEPKIKSGKKSLPEGGDIVLDGISFKYSGSDKNVLKNVSMKFGQNEKVAIVGTNGAGKSTIVKLLLRLYDCEGDILYGNTPIKDLDLDEYRGIFSSVMQDYHTFALSVAENVVLRKYSNSDEETVKTALEKSGLYEKIKGFKFGIDTVMTKEFDSEGEVLSGGEQQKLAISHIYSKENRFVILDEPSSALDPIAEYEMYERMIAACENCGIIFISHRLSTAVIADRIYMLENGCVIENGSHSELMELNGKYADMFRKQAENYVEEKE